MFQLGLSPSERDSRVPFLHEILPSLKAPATSDWYSGCFPTGIPLLGNGHCGDCFWATIQHYLTIAEFRANNIFIHPTTDETLAAYSACTGYHDKATDKGTQAFGPQGGFPFWINSGINCAGQQNHLDSFVSIRLTLQDLQTALGLGPILAGAQMHAADINLTHLWDLTSTPIVGGHEFLIAAHGAGAFKIVTWNGIWTATDEWVSTNLLDAVLVIDPYFFNQAGIDPTGLNLTALKSAMEAL